MPLATAIAGLLGGPSSRSCPGSAREHTPRLARLCRQTSGVQAVTAAFRTGGSRSARRRNTSCGKWHVVLPKEEPDNFCLRGDPCLVEQPRQSVTEETPRQHSRVEPLSAGDAADMQCSMLPNSAHVRSAAASQMLPMLNSHTSNRDASHDDGHSNPGSHHQWSPSAAIASDPFGEGSVSAACRSLLDMAEADTVGFLARLGSAEAPRKSRSPARTAARGSGGLVLTDQRRISTNSNEFSRTGRQISKTADEFLARAAPGQLCSCEDIATCGGVGSHGSYHESPAGSDGIGAAVVASWPPTPHQPSHPMPLTNISVHGEADGLYDSSCWPTPPSTKSGKPKPSPRRFLLVGASPRGSSAPSWISPIACESSTSLRASLEGSNSDALSEEGSMEAEIDQLDEVWSIFLEYSSAFNGTRFINGPDLECFFDDFKRESGVVVSSAIQEQLYSEQLQLQQDVRFKFELSRAQSSRGLCFESFRVLLGKALPTAVSNKLARAKHIRYAGIASRSPRKIGRKRAQLSSIRSDAETQRL